MDPTQAAGTSVSKIDGDAPDKTDFANYFCTYGYLYHQKDMLEDHKRTGAYYEAIINNRDQFKDRVVLDVGAGSGILSIFAAMAGARKVYAVEATDVAKMAKRLVAANKLDGVVEVVQGTIETVELPEKVDIIVSEWMGYFLLRESMLDSVLVARDRFLRPGGSLYPSHAAMWLAPISTAMTERRLGDFDNSMENWERFSSDMHQYYNVDMGSLTEAYRTEQAEYFMQTASWSEVHPSQLQGAAAQFASFDLNAVTLDEIKDTVQAEVLLGGGGSAVEGLCGYFTVDFKGSSENPATTPLSFSTRPDPTGATHWGQMTFPMHPSLDASGAGERIKVAIKVDRRKDNSRLLLVKMTVGLVGEDGAEKRPPRDLTYNID